MEEFGLSECNRIKKGRKNESEKDRVASNSVSFFLKIGTRCRPLADSFGTVWYDASLIPQIRSRVRLDVSRVHIRVWYFRLLQCFVY